MTNKQWTTVQPMTTGEPLFRVRYAWMPSAVERLAALEDPEMAERVTDYDKRKAEDREVIRRIAAAPTKSSFEFDL